MIKKYIYISLLLKHFANLFLAFVCLWFPFLFVYMSACFFNDFPIPKTKQELNKLSTVKYQFCPSTSLFGFPAFLLASSTVLSCYFVTIYAPFFAFLCIFWFLLQF